MPHIWSRAQVGVDAVALTTISDFVIWAKHIQGDPHLSQRVLALHPGEVIQLAVDGVAGTWCKMDDGRDGRPTRGLRPLGRTQAFWRELYAKRRGDVVSLELAAEAEAGPRNPLPIQPPPGVSPAERAAALESYLSIRGQGWRSEHPYGAREDLYER